MVQNRIAVIAPSSDAFWKFMKPFTISNYSKARNKFWIHKGATEYLFATGDLPGVTLSDVIMLSACGPEHVELYYTLQKNIGTTVTTQAEVDKETKIAATLDNGEYTFDSETT